MKRMSLGALALITALALAPVASAGVWTNASGSICKAYFGSDALAIQSSSMGVQSMKSSSTLVTCPITRRTINSYGAYVYADVKHLQWTTTSCTVYSFAPGGIGLAAASGSWTGSGTGSVFMNVAGSGKSSWKSDYAVLCTIPASGAGVVTGVHIDEQ